VLIITYVDLYLIHTPFAFQPGDNFDPRDEKGGIIYDDGVTLLETWRAMENLAEKDKCRAIGLSDVTLEKLVTVYQAARIKPAVVQVESHPYLPQSELLEFCKQKGIVLLAFAPLGHGMRPGPLEDPVVLAIAQRASLTPAQVLLAWAIQRGTALLTTSKTPERIQENYNVSAISKDAVEEINRIQTRSRLNSVVQTGVPGFIARGG
jgi:alcohol dehydrogenase (NADP+)